jgi:REP element-mobilizing transposase RayT
MLDHPVYFLSWHSFGTWLPGDRRGWVERDSSDETDIQPGDVEQENGAVHRMNHLPVILNQQQRSVVERTAFEVCKYRGGNLLAVNCRTNHVHVMLLACKYTPEQVMNTFKSWFSRRLNEMNPISARRHWWVRYGSTRYLNTEQAVNEAVDYVLNRQ